MTYIYIYTVLFFSVYLQLLSNLCFNTPSNTLLYIVEYILLYTVTVKHWLHLKKKCLKTTKYIKPLKIYIIKCNFLPSCVSQWRIQDLRKGG